MKKFYFLLLPLLLLMGLMNHLPAQEGRFGTDPEISLPHEMTAEELLRKGEIGKDFITTPPAVGPVRNVAEFEKMQSVLIRYPLGISYSIVKEMAENLNVITIVGSLSEKTQATNSYIANGVNINNCTFLIAPTNSYWTRDYGPWFVFDGNDEAGIVDFPYNRPRPLDDEIPVIVANSLGINLFGMNVIHTGGNYMTEGMGISSSTELVWEENPSLTHSQVSQMFQDYLGIGEYHVLPDPNNTYIDHIDCWGKFLDVDKVLIREVPPGHSQYDEIEATAAYFSSQNSSYGIPFQVFRVYTPDNQPYTNSIILNKKVLVPITGSSWDDEALETYQEAMPGYEILGFTGSWESTDALHCRAIGIADIGMLYIHHLPLLGNQPVQPEYLITAEITAHSGESIYSDSVYIIYSVNSSSWDTIQMTYMSGKQYAGSIPANLYGSEIRYYLYAADQSGRNATHPFIGEPDPHIFYIGEPGYPEMNVSPPGFSVTLPLDGSSSASLNLSNSGVMTLSFEANVSYSAGLKSVSQVYPSSANYCTGTTTSSNRTQPSLVKGNPPNEAGWMTFDISSIPDGSTINSVEFSGYVYGTNWPYWNINPVNNDPLTADPSILYNDIRAEANAGYYLYRSESQSFSTGWKVHLLEGTANQDLESALPQDWFAIGIMDRDASQYYINFEGWNETNKPYLTIDYTYTPSYNWLTLDGGPGVSGSVPGQNNINIIAGFDANGLEVGIYTANIVISSNDPGLPLINIPVTMNVVSGSMVSLKTYLEGPFNGTQMSTALNQAGYLPLNQPYHAEPWNYTGTESVTAIPGPDIVDWVLVEYRDAPSASQANSLTTIGKQAAFLLNNGHIVDLDGSSPLTFGSTLFNQLFAVVRQRNHLSVLSANPLNVSGGNYNYDFSSGESQVYGGGLGHKELSPGIWGMMSGDGDANEQVNNSDKNSVWQLQTGTSGYKSGDFNLDGQVNNTDKIDKWRPNTGKASQVPN